MELIQFLVVVQKIMDTGFLKKKVQDIGIRKKNIRDIWMEIPYLSPSFEETRYGYFAHWDR